MKRLMSCTAVALLLATGVAFAAEDAAQPNAAQSDQTQPNAAQSDQTQPNAASSDQTQPNAAQPDQTQPNAALSDQTQPNAALSDQTQPNAAQSDQTQPNAALSDQTQPNAALSDQTQPNAAQSDQTQPNAAAQDQAAAPSEPMATSRSEEMAGSLANGALPISGYYNQAVYDNRDNKIGDINDLLLDSDGKVSAAIIGVGGVLGVGERNVAVPFSLLKVADKEGSHYLVLEANKEALQTAPGYVYDSGKKVWLPATKQG